MSKLQIGVEIDVTGDDRPEIRVTPVDVAVPDHVAHAARIVAAYLDGKDGAPYGEAEVPFSGRIPIRVAFVRTQVEVDGAVFFRVVS